MPWDAPDHDELLLDDEVRRMICDIRRMDHEIGDFILTSGGMMSVIDDVIDSEIRAYGGDPDDEMPREGYQLVGMLTLPWGPKEICEFNVFVTGEDMRIPAGMAELLEWVNTSPYDHLITASVFLSDADRLDGMDHMTAWLLFRSLLFDTGLRNIGSCRIYDRLFGGYDVESGKAYGTRDHQTMIRDVVSAVHESYEEAMEVHRDKDISKGLDGNELSFVRHSRSYKGTFTVQDASTWTNGLEDQAVRGKLSRLTELGLLTKEGRTRGTRFRYNDPCEGAREAAEQRFIEEFGDFSFTEGK